MKTTIQSILALTLFALPLWADKPVAQNGPKFSLKLKHGGADYAQVMLMKGGTGVFVNTGNEVFGPVMILTPDRKLTSPDPSIIMLQLGKDGQILDGNGQPAKLPGGKNLTIKKDGSILGFEKPILWVKGKLQAVPGLPKGTSIEITPADSDYKWVASMMVIAPLVAK